MCVPACSEGGGGGGSAAHVCLDALSGPIVGVFRTKVAASGRRRVEGKKCGCEKRRRGSSVRSFSQPLRDSLDVSLRFVCLRAPTRFPCESAPLLSPCAHLTVGRHSAQNQSRDGPIPRLTAGLRSADAGCRLPPRDHPMVPMLEAHLVTSSVCLQAPGILIKTTFNNQQNKNPLYKLVLFHTKYCLTGENLIFDANVYVYI